MGREGSRCFGLLCRLVWRWQVVSLWPLVRLVSYLQRCVFVPHLSMSCLCLCIYSFILSACAQLCINDISPSSTVLATLNALALTVNSGVRAFAPIAGTSIFAAGIKWGWADGHLIWILLFVLALALNAAVWWLPEEAEGRPKKVGSEG